MSNKLKAMQFPKYLKTNRGTYTVVGPIDGFDYFSIDLARSLEAGKGYLNYCDDTIWIFADKKPVHSTQAPYFWVDVGNNGARFVRSRPANMILEQFSKKHLLELSEESIKEETRKMPEKSPDDDEFLEMNFKSNEVFTPPINVADDPLKKIVKYVLNRIRVSLGVYKTKTFQKYQLSNMKQALLSNTKMSITYFNQWAEILGFEYEITIHATEDAINPLPETLYFLSTTNTVYTKEELEASGYELDITHIQKKEDGIENECIG